MHCSTVCHSGKTALEKRSVVTVTNNGCTAVCWDKTHGNDCNVNCGDDFSTHLHLPTPKPSPAPHVHALHKRGHTATGKGCTAVCWDLKPGTGCDVQCRESGITKMPAPTSGVSSLWTVPFTLGSCSGTCQDLLPGAECRFQCPDSLPTQVPGKTSHFICKILPCIVRCSHWWLRDFAKNADIGRSQSQPKVLVMS